MSRWRCPDCGEGFATTEEYHQHMDREHRPRPMLPEPSPAFLIWSEEHGAWWGPARRGYTRSMREAGRYSVAEANAIAQAANWGGQFNECVVPVPSYPGGDK